MSKPKSQRSGRRNNNDRIRELVSILGSLSRLGDSVSISSIAARMGLGEDEARDMMDIVCGARGEDTQGLLISCNDDETEYTLQYPGTRGRPIRLTRSETIAVVHALDAAGVGPDDPLRERIRNALSSSEVDEEEVRKALGSTVDHLDSLFVCAQSRVEGRSLLFDYKGLRDGKSRRRWALVRSLHTEEGHWYAESLDLDLDEARTFRVDRMSDVRLGPAASGHTHVIPSNIRKVRITFTDKSYYHLFDWPGLRILEDAEDSMRCEIPYYGEHSTWLLRRICAGKGSIIVEDSRIMDAARNYACTLLGAT